MSSGNKKSAIWRQALKMINSCPVCNTGYDLNKQGDCLEKGNVKLAHFTCSECGSCFLAMVIVSDKSVSTVGAITDLNFEDLKRLHEAPPLETDEMLDGLKFLETKQIYKKLYTKV